MKNKIPVSTASTIHGLKIDESIGFISSHVVAGTNIFSDIFASLSDVFGGRSETYKNQLTSIKNEAVDLLMEESLRLGGDGIVGMSIDLDEVSGGSKSMFMVTASGTAVKINKESITSKSLKENSGTNAITSFELDELLFKAKMLTEVKSKKLRFEDDVFKKIIENNIFEIRDYILCYMHNSTYTPFSNESDKANFIEQMKVYFSMMPKKMAVDTLYLNLNKGQNLNSLILNLIKDLRSFDYEHIIDLLRSDELEKQKLALKAVLFDKTLYTVSDIENHQNLIKIAEESIKPVSEVYEVKKMMGTKNVWKCICNHEVLSNDDECTECGRDIFGFRNNEVKVQRAVTRLRNRVVGLKMAFQNFDDIDTIES